MRYVKIQNHGMRLPNYLECILQVVPMVHGSTYRKSKKSTKRNEFVTIMTRYHKLTENITLKHFQFRSNLQKENEI